MYNVFEIICSIKFLESSIRTEAIFNEYKPAFKFPNSVSFASGKINLLSKEKLNKGDDGLARIAFVTDRFLGDYKVGTRFEFYEGSNIIGYGHIIEILGWS